MVHNRDMVTMTNRTSYVAYQMSPLPMTLSNPKCPKM